MTTMVVLGSWTVRIVSSFMTSLRVDSSHILVAPGWTVYKDVQARRQGIARTRAVSD